MDQDGSGWLGTLKSALVTLINIDEIGLRRIPKTHFELGTIPALGSCGIHQELFQGEVLQNQPRR